MFRPLNSKERERLKRLEDRCQYLRMRIAVDGDVHTRRVAELSALTWAIDAIEAMAAGTYQPPPCETREGRERPTAIERAERRAAHGESKPSDFQILK